MLKYTKQYFFITLVRVTEEHARNFAAQVLAINSAFRQLQDVGFDFIGNLDADICLEPDYYQNLLEQFAQDPDLGLAGGFIFEEKNGVFQSRATNSTDSVAHALQIFRRDCFQDVGFYVPLKYGGPDWFAEVSCTAAGLEVRAFPELRAYHNRPTVGAEGLIRGRLRQGRMDHSVGSLFLFEVLKCLRRIHERPAIVGAAVRFYGFLSSAIARAPRLVPDSFAEYLQQEQKGKITGDILRHKEGRTLSSVAENIP